MIGYPLSILVKKFSFFFNSTMMKMKKNVEKPSGRGSLCPNFYEVKDLIFFYEFKTTKNLGSGGIYAQIFIKV